MTDISMAQLLKNNSKIRAGSGHQNIKQIKSGWRVIIGTQSIGIFPTEQEAVERRDAARIKQGLPKADY